MKGKKMKMMKDDGGVQLPPGFLFEPTDEELILHFLYPKVGAASRPNAHPNIIPDLLHHLFPCDPWQLHGRAFLTSHNRWYYFYGRKMDAAPAEPTETGYWKEVDSEEAVVVANSGNKAVIGLKRNFEFYVNDGELAAGRGGGGGLKTDWLMQEYSLLCCTTTTTTAATIRRANHQHHHQLGTNSKLVLYRAQERRGRISQDSDDELSSLDEDFFSSLDDNIGDDEIISYPN